jgi:hypothetical protein
MLGKQRYREAVWLLEAIIRTLKPKMSPYPRMSGHRVDIATWSLMTRGHASLKVIVYPPLTACGTFAVWPLGAASRLAVGPHLVVHPSPTARGMIAVWSLKIAIHLAVGPHLILVLYLPLTAGGTLAVWPLRAASRLAVGLHLMVVNLPLTASGSPAVWPLRVGSRLAVGSDLIVVHLSFTARGSLAVWPLRAASRLAVGPHLIAITEPKSWTPLSLREEQHCEPLFLAFIETIVERFNRVGQKLLFGGALFGEVA